MRCHVCDKAMQETEIQVSPDGKTYEPCAVCMEIIMDAAYSDGFTKDVDEEQILEDSGEIETLDPDIFVSTFNEHYVIEKEDDYYD